MRAALTALALTAACSPVGEREPAQATLELRVRRSALDPAGTNVVIAVTGAGIARVYRSADFSAGLAPFPVPDSGTITVSAQVDRNGDRIAQGSVSWRLRPEWRWWVEMERGFLPSDGLYPEPDECTADRCPANTRLRCVYPYCQGVWRFVVLAEAAQVERESLWLTLFGMSPDACPEGAICN